MEAFEHLETKAVPRQTPRWWRQFVVLSRRVNLFAWLEALCALVLIGALTATYLAYAGDPSSSEMLPTTQVSLLLMATLVPAVALLVLVGRRVALRRAAGSTARLHVRLVFFFSLVAAIPTLLVAGFAGFLFQSGVDFWFSDDSRGLMQNANELARSYYDENQGDVERQTITMAGDIRFLLEQRGLNDERFPDLFAFQAQAREISESAILQRLDDGSVRTAAIMNLTEDNQPLKFSEKALLQLDQGSLVVVEGSPERISALAPIDLDSGIYLYNARTTDAALFNSWSRAQAVSTAYDTLNRDARTLQLRFTIALVTVSLLLVGTAIWFALRFADRQVRPLTDLVGAARSVGKGNFAMRVDGRTGADEIGLLNRAFNRMTAQLEKQTDDLVSANRQLDDRRAFTEAVLESVTAGIISVDQDSNIALMNSTAQTLLADDELSNTNPDDLVGQALSKVSPDISQMLEESKDQAIVSHAKGGDLLTLAVKVAPGTSGHVITFEDITRQLLDQRRAAWSDVARRIAHEIKNPLTPIQLATERLKRRYRKHLEDKDGELFDELTSTIVRQVGDLRKMVDEFSSFARMPKPMFRSEDAVDLVRQAVFLQEVAHLDVKYTVSSEALENRMMLCDRHQVGQAMTNVLKNAFEAVQARAHEEGADFAGSISTSISGDEHFMLVAVEDNGIGLPADADRDRLTEPYVTTREKGTGLGLAIVSKIVDEHGGDMTFANGDSGGTKVMLRFARDPQLAETETV